MTSLAPHPVRPEARVCARRPCISGGRLASERRVTLGQTAGVLCVGGCEGPAVVSIGASDNALNRITKPCPSGSSAASVCRVHAQTLTGERGQWRATRAASILPKTATAQ